MTLHRLATLWQDAGEVSSISGDILRLLILLVCRREEVARMRWSELNLNKAEWTLPAERTKGKREHHILEERRLKDDPTTLEELSKQYNISRERVRQIEVRAFEKLQKAIRNAAIEERLATV